MMRSNSVFRFIDTLITASPDFFNDKKVKKSKRFSKLLLIFCQRKSAFNSDEGKQAFEKWKAQQAQAEKEQQAK